MKSKQQTSLILALYLLAVYCAPPSGTVAQISHKGSMNESLQTDATKELQSTLSKIYPIETPVTLLGQHSESFWDTRLCWKFFRPDPIIVSRLSQAVSSFQSDFHWSIAGARGGGICIAVLVAKNPDTATQSRAILTQPRPILAEIPQLCNHIERSLGLSDIQPKLFQYDYRVPPLTEVSDFWDPGTHTIWVTNAPTGLEESHAPSTNAQRLGFGLNFAEWRALNGDLFGWAPNRLNNQIVPETNRAYPTLARLSETESEMLEAAEIHNLREECLRAYEKAQDTNSFRALNKLVIACNWAIKQNRGLYFRGP